ncbi:MAG: HAD-IC family P-type ATPase, partial [Candidatus Chromulinivorax sp.]
MATGDHLQTATLIGQKIGMINKESDAIASQDFENLSDDQIFNLIQNKNFVCARFSPQDKLRLVQIFTQHKKIVATTGDGINDVPALVASDVSIAMGTTGSQLTKQTADLVILNDAFENIMFAIHQGKTVFHAVRRTILYFLTSNATEVFIVFCTLACNIPLPILPSQILLLNLITDGFLDAALAMEPMHTPANHIPTDKRLTIFDNTIMYKTIFLALPASLISLGFFLYLQQYTSIEVARTTTFILLTMFQTFNAFNCRSEGKSILSIGLWTNHWLWFATAGTFIALVAIVYLAPLQYIFKTVAIPATYWLYTIAIASSVLILEESRKLLTTQSK